VVSKVPSFRCVTGIERGRSSDVRTEVNEESAETMLDSARWKAGLRLEIMEGVRTKTEGLGPFDGEPACKFGCERGSIWSSGRNACSVRIGVKKRVFRRSESVDGGSVAIGE
jgi:hypothetical protein